MAKIYRTHKCVSLQMAEQTMNENAKYGGIVKSFFYDNSIGQYVVLMEYENNGTTPQAQYDSTEINTQMNYSTYNSDMRFY